MSCEYCEVMLNSNGQDGNFAEELMCDNCGAVFVFANSTYKEYANASDMTVALLKTIIEEKDRGVAHGRAVGSCGKMSEL
jgi:hypothetical protein